MLKKFLRFLSFSGPCIMTIISPGEFTFAAVDTDCRTQQDKCSWTGCARLEEKEAIQQCEKAGWSFWNTEAKLWGCYYGCLIDQEIGRTDKVRGCHFTSCKNPLHLKKGEKTPKELKK